MNNPTLLLLILCLACSYTQAQRSTPTRLQIDNLYAGEAFDSYDLRPRTMEGSLYFREEPLPAAIQLKNGKALNGAPVRYNLERNSLEVLIDGTIYEVPGASVLEFTLEEGEEASQIRYRFVNLDQFEGAGEVEDVAFLYYLLVDRLSLLGGYEVTILKPNYNVALDAGSLNAQAVRKERFFLYDGRRLQLIPTRRKKAAELLTPFRPDVADYLKESDIDLADPGDLRRLFDWLNQP